MKSILSITFCILLITSVAQGRQSKFFSEKGDIIGEAYNSDAHDDTSAVAYAMGSNQANSLGDDESHYMSPKIVEKLSEDVAAIKSGPLTSADEVATDVNYYDGTVSLNSVTLDCGQLTSQPNLCVQEPTCGWCSQQKSCISGTVKGPETACDKKSYIFTAAADWNPLALFEATNDSDGSGFVETQTFSFKSVSEEQVQEGKCGKYTEEPHTCVKKSKCGWCGESQKCVAGSKSQPQTTCGAKYTYHAPTNWSKFIVSEVEVAHEDDTTLLVKPNLRGVVVPGYVEKTDLSA